MGKGEIARNEQFLLFPVFSTRLDNLLPFSSNLKLSSANSLSLEESKICHLVMGELLVYNSKTCASEILPISGPTQVVGMSATLSNIEDLQKFMNADVYSNDFRPVCFFPSSVAQFRFIL